MSRPSATAETLHLKGQGDLVERLVRVELDMEYYLVLMRENLVTIYVEREMPDSMGVTASLPMNMTCHRAAAIECVRRLRYGELD